MVLQRFCFWLRKSYADLFQKNGRLESDIFGRVFRIRPLRVTPLSSRSSSGLGGAARARRCFLIGHLPSQPRHGNALARTRTHPPRGQASGAPPSLPLSSVSPSFLRLPPLFSSISALKAPPGRALAGQLAARRARSAPTPDRTPCRTLAP